DQGHGEKPSWGRAAHSCDAFRERLSVGWAFILGQVRDRGHWRPALAAPDSGSSPPHAPGKPPLGEVLDALKDIYLALRHNSRSKRTIRQTNVLRRCFVILEDSGIAVPRTVTTKAQAWTGEMRTTCRQCLLTNLQLDRFAWRRGRSQRDCLRS